MMAEDPKSALITIDVQKDFSEKAGCSYVAGTEEIRDKMGEAVRDARKKAIPVIHIVRIYKKDLSNMEPFRRKQAVTSGICPVQEGSEGAEVIDVLKGSDWHLDAEKLLGGGVQRTPDGDYVIFKPRFGSFYETPLEELLKELDISHLIVLGCNYPNCPRTTIYEAAERDIEVTVLKDALSGLYDRGIEELENIGVRVIPAGQICGMQEGEEK